MKDLSQLIAELSARQLSRKQFLVLVGGSFLGMIGVFRVLQAMNTPDLANSDRGVFGEKEYGHTAGDNYKVAAKGYNSEDAFG
jgi:predicted acyltransferase